MPPTWKSENNGYQINLSMSLVCHFLHFTYTLRLRSLHSQSILLIDKAAYRSWANDSDTFLISHLDQLPCLGFRDSFSYNGNGVNLAKHLHKRPLSHLTENQVYSCIHLWLNVNIFYSMSFYLWVLHGLHSAVKGWAQWSKADQDIHLRVLLHGVCHVLIDRQQDLLVAPIKFLLVIPAEKNIN